MGRRIIEFFLPSIEHYFTGRIPKVMPSNPIPEDARFVRAWINQNSSTLWIVYECEEWGDPKQDYEEELDVHRILWTPFREDFRAHEIVDQYGYRTCVVCEEKIGVHTHSLHCLGPSEEVQKKRKVQESHDIDPETKKCIACGLTYNQYKSSDKHCTAILKKKSDSWLALWRALK